MNKIISIFIAAIIGGGVFGLSLNGLHKAEFAKNQFSANVNQTDQELLANSTSTTNGWKRNPAPEVQAKSAILVEIARNNGQQNIIWAKKADQESPIASLTKLMTAVIAAEFYQQNQNIIVTKRAIEQLDEAGNLRAGERLNTEKLLKIMLLESSNDAAFALTEPMGGPEGFVALMNLKAQDIGLGHTRYFNPNGLDPEDTQSPPDQINHSTAIDLVKLAQYTVGYHPEILEILGEKEISLYSGDAQFYHQLQTTNELLDRNPNIIGGKTGTTERAKGCLLLILKGKTPGTYLVAVVLNSPDKFGDMEKIISNYGL